MLYASIALMLLLLLLNTVFRIASFFRLGIPLLYIFFMPIIFPDFIENHEFLAVGILFVMLGLVVLSWIVTIRRKLRCRRAQQQTDSRFDG